MKISPRSLRNAAAGAVGTGALAGALLFGGVPVANAAPAPVPATSFATAGPHGADVIPAGWGHHWWHHGWGHHWGHGGHGGHFLWHHNWWNWWW